MRDPVIEGVHDSGRRPRGFWREALAALGGFLLAAILSLAFFVIVTPIAIVLRLFGIQALELHFDPNRKSYWIERRPPGPGDMSRPS